MYITEVMPDTPASIDKGALSTKPPASPPGKPASDSGSETTHLVLPHHTNAQGTIFGGTIMSWIDATAACVAYRHCRSYTVTASMDHLDFYHPVKLGDMVTLKGLVNYTGKTSMEIGVKVWSENPLTGEKTHTSTAYLTFVAVDATGKPKRVPPLLLASDEDKRRWNEASERRSRRLKHKNRRE